MTPPSDRNDRRSIGSKPSRSDGGVRTLRIGTRGSRLALAQSSDVCRRLRRLNPGLRFELAVVRTTGDEYQSVELFKRTQIGVFTKAIEKKLLERKIDLAVHSLKDLPTQSHKDLTIAAVPKRESVEDVLISRGRHSLRTLPQGAVVGTGSPRRKRQLALLRPYLKLVDIRGNLDTRIRRTVVERRYDAVVLALAGLKRIRRYMRYARVIPAENFLPAVAQAALAVQARRADSEACEAARRLNHASSERAVIVERAFLAALRGGCRVPVGVLTRSSGRTLRFRAAVISPDSGECVSGGFSAPSAKAPAEARRLAAALLKRGAAKFLREARA